MRPFGCDHWIYVDQKSSHFKVPHHHTLLPYMITSTSGIEYKCTKASYLKWWVIQLTASSSITERVWITTEQWRIVRKLNIFLSSGNICIIIRYFKMIFPNICNFATKALFINTVNHKCIHHWKYCLFQCMGKSKDPPVSNSTYVHSHNIQ